ncbi:hypothetical protein AAMO2058_001046500 [Amorphochlora amoebiformis]
MWACLDDIPTPHVENLDLNFTNDFTLEGEITRWETGLKGRTKSAKHQSIPGSQEHGVARFSHAADQPPYKCRMREPCDSPRHGFVVSSDVERHLAWTSWTKSGRSIPFSSKPIPSSSKPIPSSSKPISSSSKPIPSSSKPISVKRRSTVSLPRHRLRHMPTFDGDSGNGRKVPVPVKSRHKDEPKKTTAWMANRAEEQMRDWLKRRNDRKMRRLSRPSAICLKNSKPHVSKQSNSSPNRKQQWGLEKSALVVETRSTKLKPRSSSLQITRIRSGVCARSQPRLELLESYESI